MALLESPFSERLSRRMPATAPPDQLAAAAALSRVLEDIASLSRKVAGSCRIACPPRLSAPIPQSVFHVLRSAVEVMARGDGVVLVPIPEELSSGEAAALIGVSQETWHQLYEAKSILPTEEGEPAKVRLEDVIELEERRQREQSAGSHETEAVSTVANRTLEERLQRGMPVTAAPGERSAAEALGRALSATAQLKRNEAPSCNLLGPRGETAPIPESVFSVLEYIADKLGHGIGVALRLVGKELTASEAAQLLRLPLQTLQELLEQKRIPLRREGEEPRVLLEDVIAFDDKRNREREANFLELVRLTEEYGLYDE